MTLSRSIKRATKVIIISLCVTSAVRFFYFSCEYDLNLVKRFFLLAGLHLAYSSKAAKQGNDHQHVKDEPPVGPEMVPSSSLS